MRPWRVRLAAFMALGLVVMVGMAPVFASVEAEQSDETFLDHAHAVRGVLEMDGNATMLGGERCVNFDPSEFVGVGSSTATPLTGATSPALIFENNMVALKWRTPETHPAQKTFRIPDNYYNGGTFKVMASRSMRTATAPSLDFEVYVNRSITAFDAAATNQTPVQLSSSVGDGSPAQMTLTVATDFASLAAGDTVTWNLWRTSASTDDLSVYAGSFCYNAKE